MDAELATIVQRLPNMPGGGPAETRARVRAYQREQMAPAPGRGAGAAARAWNYYLGENRPSVSPYAAPSRAEDLAGLPPTYLMTAELDPLRDEGIEYALRLLHPGVSVELHQFAGAFHGFDLLPSAISRRALDEQVHWLRAFTKRHRITKRSRPKQKRPIA
jgi:acetyl esterase/lipase